MSPIASRHPKTEHRRSTAPWQVPQDRIPG
jgi:hypothetical protein